MNTTHTIPTPVTSIYVEVIRASHTYTATVNEPGQLERYCSTIDEPFKLGKVSGDFPDKRWFVRELNRISRFGRNTNTTSNSYR